MTAFGRFRPIRRDSDSAESQSSASLAGGDCDVDVVVANKLPPRSAAAAHTSAASTAARHRRLKPTPSSGGSASSYDNLDERSTPPPPRHARLQPWLSRSTRVVRHTAAAKPAGSGTDEALDESTERLTPAAPSSTDVSNSTSVWRRPTLDGHFQVVPPTMIGVFDPTAQLSKFARQTSTKRTSPVKFQRRSDGSTAKVLSETVPIEPIRIEDVRQTNRVRDNTDVKHDSPPRTLADISQLLESTKTTGFRGNSPTAKPSTLTACETAEAGEATVSEVTEPPADDVRHSSTSSSSSSSSSSDDEEDDAERGVNVDNDEGTLVRAEHRSPEAVKTERNETPTASTSGSARSSLDGSPGADDVSEHKTEQAATFDEQSATTTSVTPSREVVALGGHVDDSPLPVPVSATSELVDDASVQVNSDIDVQQPEDVKDEASSFSASSSSSASDDEQDGDFDRQPELRISTTDHGTSHIFIGVCADFRRFCNSFLNNFFVLSSSIKHY